MTTTPAPAPRITRIRWALELAHVAALPAACTRRQVGVAILDADHRVAALGYNGTPAGELHCTDGGCPRGAYTYDQIPGFLGNNGHDVPCTARHAEDNATDWALTHGTEPTTSLVAITCAPCPDCTHLLVSQRWGTIVWPNPHRATSPDPLADPIVLRPEHTH